MAYPVSRALTRMSGGFGPRKPIPLPNGGSSPAFHGGVDFTPLERGNPVPAYSVGAGVVYGINLGKGAAGRNVMVRLDGDGSLWWYSHLSSIDVVKGQRVTDGQQLGLLGATGNATGVHLHLERHWPRIDAETDPWPFIENEPDPAGVKPAPEKPVVDKPAAGDDETAPDPILALEAHMFDIVDSPNHKYGTFVCGRGTKPIATAEHRESLLQVKRARARAEKAGAETYSVGKVAEQRLTYYFRAAW